MLKIESFELDHTKVKAPYVRKAAVSKGEKGDRVTKFDLRFTQPNEKFISTAAIHTLEHLLAGYMREEMDGLIDISPMGCRTGFYMICWGEPKAGDIAKALVKSLEKIIASKEIPGAKIESCGNYKDHSLSGAKEYADMVLKSKIDNL